MKFTLRSVFFGILLLAPVITLAQQPNSGLTREQVKKELYSLEQAGYMPAYPASLPAAQQRLAEGEIKTEQSVSGYGSSSAGSSQFGKGPSIQNEPQSIYFGL